MLLDLIKNHINVANLTNQAVQSLLDYLKKYGYINGDGQLDFDELLRAIELVHKFAGISGPFSMKTFNVIAAKRCGFPDVMAARSNTAKWNIRDLSYYISGWVGDGISQSEQRQIVQMAFDSWSAVANIRARETNDSRSANIILGVGQGRRDSFDGSMGVLAWCELPNGSDSQLHMKWDVDEMWGGLNPSARSIRLLNVTCHELGHGIGLDHSTNQSALMAPFYAESIAKPQPNDDIPRIQALYGPPQGAPPTTPDPQTPKLVLEITGDNLKFNLPGYRIQKIG